jgi:hypothetical protein
MQVRSTGSPKDSIICGNSNEKGQLKQPKSLSSILDEHWPKNNAISLLDIDCEEHDLQVLKSNNWEKYRPLLVCVEDFVSSEESMLQKHMENINYSLLLRLRHSAFFIDKAMLGFKYGIY